MNRRAWIGVIAMVAALWVPSAAWACGLFVEGQRTQSSVESAFAGLTHDVDRMLWIDRGKGRWTVYIGRQWEGHEGSFAWVIPVPGEPDVGVGPQNLFDELERQTAPRFRLERQSQGHCAAEERTVRDTTVLEDRPIGFGASAPAREDTESSPGVALVAEGQVGPFEHVTLSPGGADQGGSEVLRWLDEHDYAVGAVDEEKLEKYVERGMKVLALRLRSDAAQGTTQPVAISFDAHRAMIPLTLAASGAAARTEVAVWVAGEGPAYPIDTALVEPNLAALNWFDLGEGYKQLVGRAIEEVGEVGFSREFMEPVDRLDFSWGWSVDEERWRSIWENYGHEHQGAMLDELVHHYGHQPYVLEQLLDSLGVEEGPSLEVLRRGINTRGVTLKVSGGGTTSEVVMADCSELRDQGHRPVGTIRPGQEGEAKALGNCLEEASETVRQEVAAPGGTQRWHYVDWGALVEEANPEGWDGEALYRRLDEEYFRPLIEFRQRLEGARWLTRLYGVLPPEMMDRDIALGVEEDGRSRGALRPGDLTVLCSGEERTERGQEEVVTRPWTLNVDGMVVRGHGDQWPVMRSEELPAFRSFEVRDESKEVVREEDLSETIQQRLDHYDEAQRVMEHEE